jgi:hypothetical protein
VGGLEGQAVNGAAHSPPGGLADALGVYLLVCRYAKADGSGMGLDVLQRHLSLGRSQGLAVVHQAKPGREGTFAGVGELRGQDYRRRDYGACQGTASRLIHTRDQGEPLLVKPYFQVEGGQL